MDSSAELSSLTSTLEDVARRITSVADDAARRGEEEVASELFGVERSLTGALRRLRRLPERGR